MYKYIHVCNTVNGKCTVRCTIGKAKFKVQCTHCIVLFLNQRHTYIYMYMYIHVYCVLGTCRCYQGKVYSSAG